MLEKSIRKVHCLPPTEKGQNPYFFVLRVWRTRRAAEAGFRKLGFTWSRDMVGCFVHSPDTDCLGSVYLLRDCPHQLQTLVHEIVHVAEAFAARHHSKRIAHCPFAIGESREECVAYVTGYLVERIWS